MAGTDADIWVCGQCRSVNKLRAKQCYNCRTPKDRAEVDPSDIAGTGHGKLREIALPEFQSSRGAAMLASVMIVVVAVVQVIATIARARLANTMLNHLDLLADPEASFPPDLQAEVLTTATINLFSIGIALFALAAWAYWLSRVVAAMPALGLGYPAANAFMAFVENFLPGLNLIRVPAIVRDVVRRLEPGESPGQSRGEALIFAAWIGLIGGFVVPRVWSLFGGFGLDTVEQIVERGVVVEGISTGLVLIGAIFLVALMWWIEARILRRHAEQLQGIPPTSSEPPAEPASVQPRHATPVDAPMPFAPLAAPFAPAMVTEAADPIVPAAPFAPSPGASQPPATAMAPGPLGAVTVDPTPPDYLHRPITAVTGRGSAVVPAVAGPAPFVEATAVAEGPPMVETPTLAAPSVEPPPPATPNVEPAPRAAPDVESGPLVHVPTGPRLHLRVESSTKMIATLDGESEGISLDELRSAAGALARADGSATIATTAITFEAKSLAQKVFEILSDARVPTTMED
jgi:hypothetical protein